MTLPSQNALFAAPRTTAGEHVRNDPQVKKALARAKPGRSFIAENIFVIQDFEIDPSEELGYPCDAEDDSKSARIEMQRSPILDLRDELLSIGIVRTLPQG